MPFIIYLRKSRADVEAELRGEGETLARHKKILLDLAKRQKLHISEIYQEIVSGETISSRPFMQKLLIEVEQGMWEGVLVVEIDRLARGNSIDQGIIAQTFKFSNTQIITPNKIYDPNNDSDEMFFEFSLFMSRQEYKTINRRLKQGKMSSVKEGKYLGPKQPFGYIRKKLEKEKGVTLIPHPEQAEIIKLIFELYINGENGKRYGLHALATKLTTMGIKSATGGVWSSNTLSVILKNPVYSGKIRWNYRKKQKKVIDGVVHIERPMSKEDELTIVDGKHEPIISVVTFEKAQSLMKNNRPNPNPHGLETKNPLAGIVECVLCGKKLTRIYHATQQPDTLICPTNGCKNMGSSIISLENAIIEALKGWLLDYKIAMQTKETIIDTKLLENNLKTLDNELDNLQKQFDKTYDLLEQEVYDIETFLIRSRTISEKLNQTKQNKTNIILQIKNIEIQNKAKNQIIPQINNIVDTYSSILTPSERNLLLKQVLAKVTYLKSQRKTKQNPLGNAQLILFPNI